MNYRMDISYDGTKYKGWQRQKSTGNTIQGKIEDTLSRYFDTDIRVTGASRTDAGVHAMMQVCNFKLDKSILPSQLQQEINQYLPADIVVNDIMWAEDRFHSRYNAVKKTYKYSIWRSDAKYPPLFDRKYVYCYDFPVNANNMMDISRYFIGSHDFKGFSSDKTKKTTIRNIHSIDIASDDFKIDIRITGDGFLYNMIRIIIGTMLEIDRGDKDISIIDEICSTQNRKLAGFTVPACGLLLEKIYY